MASIVPLALRRAPTRPSNTSMADTVPAAVSTAITQPTGWAQ